MPPSIEDLNSCYRNGYPMGVIACHDGKVFRYISKQEISSTLYDMQVGDFISDGLDEYDAQFETIQKLKKAYFIDFEEVNENG